MKNNPNRNKHLAEKDLPYWFRENLKPKDATAEYVEAHYNTSDFRFGPPQTESSVETTCSRVPEVGLYTRDGRGKSIHDALVESSR